MIEEMLLMQLVDLSEIKNYSDEGIKLTQLNHIEFAIETSKTWTLPNTAIWGS